MSEDVSLLIYRYGALHDAITPLATLATVSPSLLEEVIGLAMAMGIRAAERKVELDAKLALVEQDLERGKASFWGTLK